MKRFLLLLVVTSIGFVSKAQIRYLVKFKDKGTSPYSIYSPTNYLSPRAIARRTRYSINIDSLDLPVTPRYIDSVRLAGSVTILNVSKWLNQVSIQTTDAAALAKINSFPFVQSASQIAARTTSTNGGIEIFQENANGRLQADYYNYGQSYGQIHIHNGEFLHNIGLRGQGMQIGMLDGGFTNYNTITAFDSVRNSGGFLDVYNFILKNTNLNTASHGLNCLSTIATNLPGQMVGTAPKASFYLYVSEDVGSEYPIEEHNWVCAAERVDSAGGDVISSSLGYNTFDPPLNTQDHTYAQMNGRTTMAAIGATIGARKGLLILNSAGNSGQDSWHYIITPADADSILAVGAVDVNRNVAGFSSYGPASDGRVKPDVASVGVNTYVVGTTGVIGTNNGTSFACPNMAGLATCLWQGFQEFNNIKILKALQQAGDKYTAPDNRTGYGIPDVKKATMNLLKDFATGAATQTTCKTTLSWNSKDAAGMRYEIERQVPGSSSFVKIGTQLGSGAVFSNHSYTYADSLINVQAGTINYRIKQFIDTNTATAVSDYIVTKTVNLGASCVTTGVNTIPFSDNTLLLIPNPAHNTVTLKLTTSSLIQTIQVQIVDALGKLIATKNSNATTVTTTLPIDITALAKGKYFLSVYANGKLLGTKELVKL